jgi:hypothetical protein
MDFERAKKRLEGCYITIPTMFRDPDLEVDHAAIRRHVRFLMDNGFNAKYGTLLAGGAAGDFSTMTFDERVKVAETVVAQADGKIPVAMGAQTTSTKELTLLAKAAKKVGAEFIQVSCPFYFTHTEEDFFEHVVAGAEAADIAFEAELLRRAHGVAQAEADEWVDPLHIVGGSKRHRLCHLDIHRSLDGHVSVHAPLDFALNQSCSAAVKLEAAIADDGAQHIARIEGRLGGDIDVEIALEVDRHIEILVPVAGPPEQVQRGACPGPDHLAISSAAPDWTMVD